MHRLAFLWLLASALLPCSARAQQSAVCVTPVVSCKATFVGPVGAACACSTPRGWVRGRLG